MLLKDKQGRTMANILYMEPILLMKTEILYVRKKDKFDELETQESSRLKIQGSYCSETQKTD